MQASETAQPTLDFDGKKYAIDSLSQEAQSTIQGLQAAEAQIQQHEDALQLLKISQSVLLEQLKKLLEGVEPIKDSVTG